MRCQSRLDLVYRCALSARPKPSVHELHHSIRASSTRAGSERQQKNNSKEDGLRNDESPKEEEEGAMTRRMKELSEDAMLGGKSAMKNMQQAGFSDELKKQLEERIAATSFKNEHAQAFSVANMPRSAGRGTQDLAAAAPWTGDETAHDAALRMLSDSKKPLRVPFKPPNPSPVNLQPRVRASQSSGTRLAQARDRKEVYELSQDAHISEEEREAYRRELRDRFTPGARAFPMSLQGLSSLANERIEDAIAKGQFRNIPRGKGKNVERDHAAGSPYLDTTEYFMNRIMQKQEVTPEWIQKQQDLQREIRRFRAQLRSDWKSHAARLISRQGGTLQTQVRRARAYAAAEARHNRFAQTPAEKEEKNATGVKPMTQIDHEGRLSRIPVSLSNNSPVSQTESVTSTSTESIEHEPLPDVSCLRDPQYLAIEKEYHELKVKKLNELLRSYNLQAPRIAQKPYLNLQRELDLCYAEVAPSLAEEVYNRATQKAHDSSYVPTKGDAGALQQVLGLGQNARVHDEDTSKGYGLKQFWRDLWSRGATT
ncbi:predicted protein [Uncinocarpus reesii 1704]|uniref:DnaJ homologue subfamily C member 28 conserved domain-containing protein n=1 Tax=Uncinocarpus reesii (strain UAMH 1704) TaxID=336963 RepID=C4JVJ0_UNCRE|nr:uncharacterized protein UREG_06582 [Uncinocarpus reesii 1704]EEP81717.1 predicted protein [Uncinocarpus reesii 1704]